MGIGKYIRNAMATARTNAAARPIQPMAPRRKPAAVLNPARKRNYPMM